MINNQAYDLEELSDSAKRMIVNIKITDIEIKKNQTLIEILQTAKATYLKELNIEIKK